MIGDVSPRFAVAVPITGQDPSSYAIIVRVAAAIYSVGGSVADVHEFVTEAQKGSFNHLLATVGRWVNPQ